MVASNLAPIGRDQHTRILYAEVINLEQIRTANARAESACAYGIEVSTM